MKFKIVAMKLKYFMQGYKKMFSIKMVKMVLIFSVHYHTHTHTKKKNMDYNY